MRTQKRLYKSMLALGLSAGTMPVYAQFPLTVPEKAAVCLVESCLSTFATVVEFQGCSLTAGTYSISAGVNGAGNGSIQCDKVTYNVTSIVKPAKGQLCDVKAPSPGSVASVDINSYNTDPVHAWNRKGTIFVDQALLHINSLPPHVFWDEKSIKNWKAVDRGHSFIDDGLEVITKMRFPRSKWKENSEYKRNPEDTLRILKKRITGGTPCSIRLNASTDDAGGDFDVFGTVTVTP